MGKKDDRTAEEFAPHRRAIDAYLRAGILDAVASRSAFQSPLRTLFTYSALLISALNHEGRGRYRAFLDLVVMERNAPARKQTTLPDIDLECFPELAGVEPFAERLSRYLDSREGMDGDGDILWELELPRQRHVFLALGVGEKSGKGGNEVALASVRRGLGEGWARMTRYKALIADSLNNWVASQTEPWPEALKGDSQFNRTGQEIYDNFRELLDHLYLDLCAITASPEQPNPCDDNWLRSDVYFIRKSRYYLDEGSGQRARASRALAEQTEGRDADFLLNYFLSWGELAAIKEILSQKVFREELVEQVQSQLSEKPPSTKQKQRAEQFCKDAKARDRKRRQMAVIEALETPFGKNDHADTVQRSVFDTAFLTRAPEIVWDIDDDDRLKKFKQAAKAELNALEMTLWPDRAKSAAYIFIPFTFGADVILGAYALSPLARPFSDHTESTEQGGLATGWEQLESTARLIVQANRTYMHWMIDSYSRVIQKLFVDGFTRLLSDLNSKRMQLERHNTVKGIIEVINEGCLAAHLIYGLPKVQFWYPSGGNEGQSLWQCYKEVAEDVRASYGRNVWPDEKAEAYFLHEIGLNVAHRKGEQLGALVHRELASLIGLYIMHDLLGEIAAFEHRVMIGNVDVRRKLSHQLGELLGKMGNAVKEKDTDFIGWSVDIIKGVVRSHGGNGNNNHESWQLMGSCDLRAELPHIGKCEELGDQLMLRSNIKMQSMVVLEPEHGEQWVIALPSFVCFEILTNMLRNAADVLDIYCCSRDPHLDDALGPRIRSVFRTTGNYRERFGSGSRPTPKRLALIRHMVNRESIVIEIFDNAPELSQGTLEYRETSPDGHFGMQVIDQYAAALSANGGHYESPHRLADALTEVRSELAEICSRDKRLTDYDLADVEKWTRTAFTINEVTNNE